MTQDARRDSEPARCSKCHAPITLDQNVVFPNAGGVEHRDCDKTRKPLALANGAPLAPCCLVCDEPVVADDALAMGRYLVHDRCLDPSARHRWRQRPSPQCHVRALISDPFAHLQWSWRRWKDLRGRQRRLLRRTS